MDARDLIQVDEFEFMTTEEFYESEERESK